TLGPTRSAYLRAVGTGEDRELALVGPRGTKKTSTVLDGAVLYAQQHHAAGGTLPVRTRVVGSTGVQVRAALRVIEAPWWQGAWQFEDDERVLRCTVDGRVVVVADVVGVEDMGTGADRLRRRYHVLIGDDPAPAMAEISSGFTSGAWAIALSGLDLPSPVGHRALLAMNAGSRSHWTTRRFLVAPGPGCRAFRIAPEEELTPARRAELDRDLAPTPDLHARLALGEPADPVVGRPVCQGYTDRLHVAPRPLVPVRGADVWLGWDAGLTPVCLIAQVVDGELRIYAGLTTERGGTADFIEAEVQPWFVRHMPWALQRVGRLTHCVDPSMVAASQHDSRQSPANTLRAKLGGGVRLGPVKWPARRDPLLALFNKAVAGRPVLQFSPVEETELLRRACAGGWHYAVDVAGTLRGGDDPKKTHPDSDLGDALTYLVAELFPADGATSWAEAVKQAAHQAPQYATGTLRRDWHGEPRRASGPLS
ncbi:MAG TPA: hypothetical protein VMK65_11810, partial [Longimicrobiales bacterium]|nr:hypothetical protein [Longimicrobiales bacterium]